MGRQRYGKKPNKGATKAKFAYTGSPFKLNRRYAEHFGYDWVILSAKYGFIDPDFEIPKDYNITFNDPKTNPISLRKLTEQAKKNQNYDCIIALGGKTYSNIAKLVFKGKKIVAPVYGLPIGKTMSKVKTAIETNTPFICE